MMCAICLRPYWATELIHNLEGHGILPDRAPQLGDPVYPFDTPATLFVHRATADYYCRGCGQTIHAGQLHGSGQFTKDHYCLGCANFTHGTPAGQDARRERIRQQLRSGRIAHAHNLAMGQVSNL